MHITSCGMTDVGLKRGHNEDNFLINEELNLFVVADGMGGHAGGEYASAICVNTIEEIVTSIEMGGEAGPEENDPVELARERLRYALRLAGRRIFEKASQEEEFHGMGTTAVALLVDGKNAVVAHVGDSRIYHHGDGVLTLLTRDHTRREFAARDGREYLGEKNFLVQSFVFGSRGLGHDEDLRIDAGTDTGAFDLAVGDRIVLVTVGVSGVVPDHRIGDAILEAPEPAACATWLAERAMAAGTDDNITAVVVRVDRLGRFRADSRTYDLWDDPLAATDDGGSDGGGQTG